MNVVPKYAPPAEMADVRGALAAGIARLESAAAPSAPLAAELLLLHALGRDRAWLYAHPESPLSAEQRAAYSALLDRRSAGTPVQYLTGRQEFWGMEFEVTPDVLIPRPETEHIVETALAWLGDRRFQQLEVADVGTGSGCLAAALAKELPQAHIVATDISAAALEVGRRNVLRHAGSGRVECVEMDLLFSYLGAAGDQVPRFDLIVSNPPYIGRIEAPQLPREVREHEPHAALFGGSTGVEIYTRLIEQAVALVRPRGILVFELGYNAAPSVRPLLENQLWSDVSVTRDLAGIERVLSAKRRAHEPA